MRDLCPAGRLIVEGLSKKGWTQTRFALMMGISPQNLLNYINGDSFNISTRRVVRFALALGIDPHELAHAFVDKQIDYLVDKVLSDLKDEKED